MISQKQPQEPHHLAPLLIADGLCTTPQEAEVLAEIILSELKGCRENSQRLSRHF